MPKRVLVLSGGGLFGAWQVGAWSVLRQHVSFDAIIGVSIGSLNGWAIAGGSTPEELTALWLDTARRGDNKLRIPRNPLDGLLDPTLFHELIGTLYSRYQPKVEYHAVITDLLRLKPTLIDGRDLQPCHLEASCALLGMLPQRRIGNTLYTDGGFLGALPLWAARHCHATHVVALNAMPKMPWPIRAVLKPLRGLRARPQRVPAENTLILSPSKPLGHLKQGLLWKQAEIARWIDVGREDAEATLANTNIPGQECFMA